MDKPVLDLSQHANEAFDAFVGRVSLLLVEHNVDAITATMFLRELAAAGGRLLWREEAMMLAQSYVAYTHVPPRRHKPPLTWLGTKSRQSRSGTRLRRHAFRKIVTGITRTSQKPQQACATVTQEAGSGGPDMPHGLTSPSKPSAGRLCQSDNSISRKDKAMSQHDYLHSLPATGIDIPLEIRLYVIQLLQQTLLCTVDLHSHVKQACWNVKGHNGSQLQALFAGMARTLDTYSDLLAERLVVLGGVAWGTTRIAACHSTLPEYPEALREGAAHVRALAERFAPYATLVRNGIARTAEVEDAGSAAVYTDLSRGIDQQLSNLEAYLLS